jgi:hypothetical protein
MHRKLRWPSPAFVVALTALLVALGGTAVAAGPPFLKFGTPAGGDLAGTYPNPTIAANAVESAEVVDASLRSSDIAVATGVLTDVEPIPLQPGECNGPGRIIDGLQSADFVFAVASARLPNGLFVSGHIEFAPTSAVVIDVCNFSPAPITAPSTTYRFMVIR